jgi:hypothetical protein
MLRRLTLMIMLVVIVASAADASYYRGKEGRRYCRRQNLILKFRNDKLRIYREYGFPVHRLRVRGIDSTLEHWTYYEVGREFGFDEDHNLVRTRKFFPEDRRERFKRWGRRDTRILRY